MTSYIVAVVVQIFFWWLFGDVVTRTTEPLIAFGFYGLALFSWVWVLYEGMVLALTSFGKGSSEDG